MLILQFIWPTLRLYSHHSSLSVVVLSRPSPLESNYKVTISSVVWTRDAPDAIRLSTARCIFIHHTILTILQSYKSVVGTTTNQPAGENGLWNPSSNELFIWVRDFLGNQPILCECRIQMLNLVSDTRLHCDPDHTTQWMVLTLGFLANGMISSATSY